MGKNDADRTCGLRADTRGIDEIDLMEEASTGRLKAPTDGANACVNGAKFDQLDSRIRIGPVDFSPPPFHASQPIFYIAGPCARAPSST